MSNDERSTAVALRVPIAVQTRAAAVSIEAADAMLPAITAMWPADVKGNPALGRLVARIAVAYGLDPLMNEVTIYQGKPYITIDGRLRKAQEHEQYRGLECRPATEEERKNYRAADEDHLWRAEVYRKDWPKPVVGWGLVRKGDRNVVAQSTPQLMAEKRAKARALRDAFSIPLPSAEDAEDYSPAPSRYVNAATGELTDTRPGGLLASRGQISAIHVLEKQLESDAEQRHERFTAMFDKAATNELTEGEAASYLEWLAGEVEARENQRPEVIEAKRRDETPLTVPKAASKRFHTRPSEPEADEIEPTYVDAETMDEPADEGEPGEPQTGAEAQSQAAESLVARINGIALPKAWNRDGALKAFSNRLLEAEFDTDQIKAALSALHRAVTGEVLRLDMAKSNAANRVVGGLASLRDDELPTVKAMAEAWLEKAAADG